MHRPLRRGSARGLVVINSYDVRVRLGRRKATRSASAFGTKQARMSAVSVRIVQRTGGSSGDEASASSAERELAEDVTEASDLLAMPFFSGNPRVERLSGVVHLYRAVVQPSPGVGGSPSPAVPPLPVTDAVCALGVPASLSVADFCQFVGAMLPRVRDMRLVRDSQARGDDAFRYAVLLRFDAPAAAEEFFRFYHGRAVRCAASCCPCAQDALR